MKPLRIHRKNNIRFYPILLLTVFLLILYSGINAYASMKNTNAFSIEVSYQIGQENIPCQIKLAFLEVFEDFLGSILVSIPYDGSDYVLLSKKLQLEKGRNDEVKIETGLAENANMIRVDIIDAKGKLVFQHDISLTEEESKKAWSVLNDQKENNWINTAFFIKNNILKKRPVLTLYFAVLFIYICVVLPGLFIFLKKKDKIHYLREMIGITALIFSGIIFVMGASTRLTAPSLKYIKIQNISEDTDKDLIFFSVQLPYSQQIQLQYDKKYNAEGVFINEHHEKDSSILYDHYRYRITEELEGAGIYMDTSVAVKPMYFKLILEEKSEIKPVTGMLSFENEKFNGKLKDATLNEYDSCYLFYNGRIIMLDERLKEWSFDENADLVSDLEDSIIKRFFEGYNFKDKAYFVTMTNENRVDFLSGADDFEVTGITFMVCEICDINE